MSDIKLFRVGNGEVIELAGRSASVEKSLQNQIEAHMDTLLGVRFVASEYSTGKKHGGRIDTMARPGDRVLISGTMADHGMAVMCQREGLRLDTEIQSDTACLSHLVARMIDAAGPAVHVLRDPTRGGVGTTLNEIAASSNVGIELDEARLPVNESVRGACDILGLDPLYVANEGKLLALVAPEAAPEILEVMRRHPLGAQAEVIGTVCPDHPGRVVLNTTMGGRRIVDMLTGEQLPRIC